MSEVKQRLHPGVWALAVTAFAIGVAEFIVVGVLPSISNELGVPLARAGSLVGLYALALAVGTPLLVLALARFPRKPVLLGLIGVFLAGNVLSAVSADYSSLLLGRVITAVAHGSFFAIGATVAARLAPKGQASNAIAAMFAGLTLAMVVGVPLGSFLGNGFGWRLPFFAVVGLALLGLIAATIWLPRMSAPEPVKPMAQLSAAVHPAIIIMMLVTVLGFGASFAAFTFITPILTDITGFSGPTASLLLIVFGGATLVGNLLGGRIASKFAWRTALRWLLVSLAVVLAILGLVMHLQIPTILVLFVWGGLAFGISPAVQSGMLETAERYTPKAVDFASALNISAFNLGISLGEVSGSALVAHGEMGLTPWAGVVAALVAQIPLALSVRQKGKGLQQAVIT